MVRVVAVGLMRMVWVVAVGVVRMVRVVRVMVMLIITTKKPRRNIVARKLLDAKKLKILHEATAALVAAKPAHLSSRSTITAMAPALFNDGGLLLDSLLAYVRNVRHQRLQQRRGGAIRRRRHRLLFLFRRATTAGAPVPATLQMPRQGSVCP